MGDWDHFGDAVMFASRIAKTMAIALLLSVLLAIWKAIDIFRAIFLGD